MNDRKVSLFPEPVHAKHGLLKAKMFVDFQHVSLADTNVRSMAIQSVVAIRNERTQAIVATEPLEDDEDLPFGCGESLRGRTKKRGEWADGSGYPKREASGADF